MRRVRAMVLGASLLVAFPAVLSLGSTGSLDAPADAVPVGGSAPDAPPPRCKAVAVTCRAKCLGKLNGKDPSPYYRCINACLEKEGCPPGMY